MAVQGRLCEMGLSALVQLTCQEGNQARLFVERAGVEAILYFGQGNVVHATLDPGQGRDELSGEEVVYQVLGWEDGSFSLEAGVDSPAHTIYIPWSTLLMGALQRRDEERWDTIEIEQIEEEYEMAENLQDILTELGDQVTGFVAASVTGMDGLGIAQHSPGTDDMEAVNAQMTMLIKLVDTAMGKLDAGKVDHGLLTTERLYLLWRHLSDENYYLGVAADRRNVNLGNILLMSRLYAERVSKAMPR